LARAARRRFNLSPFRGETAMFDTRSGVSRETDKYLWFLEAHLHAKR
jgi:hypothetical protein